MSFKLADNYDPQIWIPGIREKATVRPGLVNSGILVRSDEFNAIASGKSNKSDIPFFRSIADQDDEVQDEDNELTPQGQGTGTQVCTMLNRGTSNNLTAMSASLGALDPLGDLLGQIADRRNIQIQKRLLASLRGTFGVTAVANALSVDHFHEDTASIVSGDVITGTYVLDAVAKLGEFADKKGIMVVHSTIRAALLKADEKDFFRAYEGEIIIERYKGMQLFVSDTLVRAGTGTGTPNVYESFIIAPGTFAYGEKPQAAGDTGDPAIDVASINMIKDAKKNTIELLDRTRTIVHPSGMKWLGTSVAKDTPSNAELKNAANWEMVAANAKLLGMTRIRTNG